MGSVATIPVDQQNSNVPPGMQHTPLSTLSVHTNGTFQFHSSCTKSYYQ